MVKMLSYWAARLLWTLVRASSFLSSLCNINNFLGTTLLIVPPADAVAIHTLIPGAQPDGQGGFTIPCTGNATVALTFAGISFSIDPRDIAVQPVDPSNPQGTCVSGIVSGTVGGATEWLAGDVFLKNVYFGTDATDKTLSLAQLVKST